MSVFARGPCDWISESRRGCGALEGAQVACLVGNRGVVERLRGRYLRVLVRGRVDEVVHRSWS